jgi:hypothetical protein
MSKLLIQQFLRNCRESYPPEKGEWHRSRERKIHVKTTTYWSILPNLSSLSLEKLFHLLVRLFIHLCPALTGVRGGRDFAFSLLPSSPPPSAVASPPPSIVDSSFVPSFFP